MTERRKPKKLGKKTCSSVALSTRTSHEICKFCYFNTICCKKRPNWHPEYYKYIFISSLKRLMTLAQISVITMTTSQYSIIVLVGGAEDDHETFNH
jgi:hypothetical protein